MAHAFQPRPAVHRFATSWPRRHRRPWLRGNDTAAAAALMAAIPSLPRAVLARITEQLINRMDELDGDPDVELNGDEADGAASHEETWGLTPTMSEGGPGCPIADEGGGDVDDVGEIGTWPERMRQPASMAGGVAVQDDDAEEDYRIRPTYGRDQTRRPVGQEMVTLPRRTIQRQEHAYE